MKKKKVKAVGLDAIAPELGKYEEKIRSKKKANMALELQREYLSLYNVSNGSLENIAKKIDYILLKLLGYTLPRKDVTVNDK